MGKTIYIFIAIILLLQCCQVYYGYKIIRQVEKLGFQGYCLIGSIFCSSSFQVAVICGFVSRENYFSGNILLGIIIIGGALALPLNLISWLPVGRLKSDYTLLCRLLGLIPASCTFLSATSPPV